MGADRFYLSAPILSFRVCLADSGPTVTLALHASFPLLPKMLRLFNFSAAHFMTS